MRFALILLILTVCVVPAVAATPELIVDIDFNDQVYIRPEPMTEAEVVKLVKDLHDAGTDTLLVRMGYLGLLPYRTELSYPMGFDEEHARKHPYARNIDPKVFDAYIAKRKQVMANYREILKNYNPPEVFIREGHKLGMKVIIWIDIFDNYYSGYRSKFLEEHPHCQWTARDGKTYFEGLISYAWPESRAFCVAMAKEFLDLGADGIHCSTSCHVRHHPNVQQNDFYGYEQPVVDEYKKLYGVDIRTADDFDKEAWHKVKGGFMNQLYRELAAECHKRDKELWVSLQLGEHTNFASDPHFSANVVARYGNLWKEMVDEKIADAFIVGDYEICTAPPNHPYWKAKTLNPPPQGDLFSWAAKQYQPYCKDKTKLYIFSEWMPHDPKALDANMKRWAKRTLDNNFDGINVHEACNFEPNKMDILKSFHEQLQGK